MKIEFNKRYTQIAIYSCAVLLLVILLAFACFNFSHISGLLSKIGRILSPLIYGFVFAYLLNPLLKINENHIFKIVERKKAHPRLKRVLSIIATYILVSICIAITVWTVIPQVGASYSDLESQLPGYIKSAQNWIDSLSESTGFFAEQVNNLAKYININEILNSINVIIDKTYELLISTVPYLMNFMTGIVNELKNALFGLVLSVYFLAGKEKLCAQIKKSCCSFIKPEKIVKISDFLSFTDKTFGGFIWGKIVDSIIIGILSFVVFIFTRIPYAPLLAVIIGITNVIPFFGPFIGAIPCVFFVFISSPPKALLLIVLIIVIQQIDGNVIGPKILGNTTGLTSLWVMVAITVMSGFFGILGMFIGVPLFAVIYATVKNITENRLRKRGLSVKTAEYLKEEDNSNEV